MGGIKGGGDGGGMGGMKGGGCGGKSGDEIARVCEIFTVNTKSKHNIFFIFKKKAKKSSFNNMTIITHLFFLLI